MPLPAIHIGFVTLLLWGSSALAQPLVVVSIHPYYDLTRQITGDAAEVVRVLPGGASPHTFEPAPSHARLVAEADLLVMNGGNGVDDWLARLIEASASQAVLVDVMQGVDRDLLVEDGHEHGGHEGEHAHGHEEAQSEVGLLQTNPHVWLDPRVAIEATNLIEEALVQVDAPNAEVYRANAETLRRDLETLDDELREMLAPVRGAAFVPFHNAWPYFARRYGLDLVLEIEPFPGREPSPAYLRDVINAIETSGARAIFAERQLSRRPAKVIAEAADVPVYLLDPEGGSGETETYQDLLRFNARTILEALGD